MSIIDLINKYADQIPEKCVECGEVTNKLPFCNLCGTFNVRAQSSVDSTIKLSTKHKNPLSLLDRSIAPEHKGLTHADILSLRYRLSEMVSGTPIEASVEQEFEQKLAPLLKDGTIGDQFFYLWADYWKKFLAINEIFSAKIIEIKKGNMDSPVGLDFSDTLSGLSQLLRNELNQATNEFLSETDSLHPLLKYANFAEKCISNTIWIQTGIYALNFCINMAEAGTFDEKAIEVEEKLEVIVRGATAEDLDTMVARNQLQHEMLMKGASWDDIESVTHACKKEKCIKALDSLKTALDLQDKLASVGFSIPTLDGSLIAYAQERLVSIKDELPLLIKRKSIATINADAWLQIKFTGFTGLRNNKFSEVDLTDIAHIPTKSIESIYQYIDTLIESHDDFIEKIQSRIQQYSDWEDDVLSALDDENEHQEAEEQIRIRREEEDRDRRYQARLLQEAQEQFLTRQISLRQKAEGRYFLSVFTEVFGADAGTYWEGVNKK